MIQRQLVLAPSAELCCPTRLAAAGSSAAAPNTPLPLAGFRSGGCFGRTRFASLNSTTKPMANSVRLRVSVLDAAQRAQFSRWLALISTNRPPRPNWSTASTGPAQACPDTDLLPKKIESPGIVRGFCLISAVPPSADRLLLPIEVGAAPARNLGPEWSKATCEVKHVHEGEIPLKE